MGDIGRPRRRIEVLPAEPITVPARAPQPQPTEPPATPAQPDRIAEPSR